MNSITLIVVLACLCFSSGEGLRLTPIPSLAPGELSSPHFRATDASLDISLSYQYAVCGQEKGGQKRVQRQQLRSGLYTSRSSIEHFPVRFRLVADVESASYLSLFPVSQPPGRAPPSA